MKTGILSIQEPYASRIFDGDKLYEFRTRAPKIAAATRFLIYVPTPKRELAGEVTVSEIISGSPQDIWERCAEYGGIERGAFFEYFEGRKQAQALRINGSERYATPAHIDHIRDQVHADFRPPQFLNWLPSGRKKELRNLVDRLDSLDSQAPDAFPN